MAWPDTAACRVCAGQSRFAFKHDLLKREVSYFDCATCGYFQTQQPDWLEQAYASAINDVDTGILWRNQLNVKRVVMTLLSSGRLSGRVVDHAGGYGILVRLLRDAGVDARWRDKYCQNLLARGFEADNSGFDLLTAFEVFEHLEHPMHELAQMLTQAPSVLLSTELVQTAAPAPDWWYLGSEHGQHIGFFRERTLAWMATALNCRYATDGRSLHIFSRQPITWRWRALQQLAWTTPLVCKLALRSRMLSDFDALRQAKT